MLCNQNCRSCPRNNPCPNTIPTPVVLPEVTSYMHTMNFQEQPVIQPIEYRTICHTQYVPRYYYVSRYTTTSDNATNANINTDDAYMNANCIYPTFMNK